MMWPGITARPHSPALIYRGRILIWQSTSPVTTGEKDYEVSVVDWESARWYLGYYEYVAVLLAFRWDEE
jgi:hypothetical protein